MAKYEPLRRYLARQKSPQVEMSFSEIERMIGALLPKRAQHQDWWADAVAPLSVQAQSWRSAGYQARLEADERVHFERARPVDGT